MILEKHNTKMVSHSAVQSQC